MRISITILIVVFLILFLVGCENSVNPINSQTQNDNEGISLAKNDKVKPDKPEKDECTTIQSGDLGQLSWRDDYNRLYGFWL